MNLAKPAVFRGFFFKKGACLGKFSGARFHPNAINGFPALFWKDAHPREDIFSAQILQGLYDFGDQGFVPCCQGRNPQDMYVVFHRLLAAQKHLGPGPQFPNTEGLGQVIVGAHLQAELNDRPLGYQLRDRIRAWQDRSDWPHRLTPAVCCDLWYLNQQPLRLQPTIAIGRPGMVGRGCGAGALKAGLIATGTGTDGPSSSG